jgi:hypothetical protein
MKTKGKEERRGTTPGHPCKTKLFPLGIAANNKKELKSDTRYNQY